VAEIESMVPEVKYLLDGAPEPAILLYLKLAAKQFCKDSGVWKATTGARTIAIADLPEDREKPLIVKSTDAAFTIPDAATLPSYAYAVDDVLLDDDSLKDMYAGRPHNAYSWDKITADLRIIQEPFPNPPFELKLRLFLQPTRAAAEVPDFLVEDHSEGITAHAIANLKMMNGKEWTDMRGASSYMRKYEHRVAEARIREAKQGTTGKIETDLIPFH